MALANKAVAAGLLVLGLAAPGAVALSAQGPPPRPTKSEPPGKSKADAPPDLGLVRKALNEWWGTLESPSFREETFALGADGRRDEGKAFSRLEFAPAPAGRFAYDLQSFNPDGSEILILKKRWDGRDYYHFYPAGNDSKEIRFAAKAPQKEPRDRYDGEMSGVMWLTFPTHPSGRPPAAPIDRGASLEVKRDSQGRYHVFLVNDKDREVRSELDPDHGWMPKRVEIGAGEVSTATEFALEAGHWFPVKGTRTTHAGNGKPLTIPFAVNDLRVNQPIPESDFNLADFHDLPVEIGND